MHGHTCQMRVSRFYQRCCLPPPASACLGPQPLQISVGTPWPQPRAPDVSGHCRTSTTSSTARARSQWACQTSTARARCQWALRGLNCEDVTQNFVECQIVCQIVWQIECHRIYVRIFYRNICIEMPRLGSLEVK